MIYYPLSTLMLAGIRDILVITTPHDAEQFERLLGDGSQFGISLTYAQQPSPDGLAQAFVIGEEHIGSDTAALVLGDNIFYGQGMGTRLRRYESLDGCGRVRLLGRRPERLRRRRVRRDRSRAHRSRRSPRSRESHYAIPGLYFYDNDVVEIAKELQPVRRAANSRSPTSTASTWNAASCRSRSFPVAPPGWTRARSTP